MNSHTLELRVRYQETDQMGVVYYSNYLVWFEIARTEYFRKRGVMYSEIEKKEKIYLPVVEAYCRYKSPLRYDDEVTIETRLADAGNSRIAFEYEVKKDGKITATGHTKHAFVDENGKPVSVPQRIKKALLAES